MGRTTTCDGLTGWLLDQDPALRWQVERDLLHESADVWQATRARVATEGFGALLLELQDDDGRWAGGAFFPADFDFDGPETAPDAGQPWTATTWSLDTLRGWGLDPTVLRERDTVGRLAASCRWEYDDLPYWGGEVDCCINGMTLANGVWLGADVGGIADWFVEHATAEGGWNCEWVEGSTRSSVRSTLNALQGLLELEESGGGSEATRAARLDGEEYLLRRGLFRRLTTGEPIADGIDSYAYPFRSHYSVLRATDYFRRAAALGGHGRDPRLAEAVELVRAARRPDGTWLQQERYPGRVWFHVDVPPGEPSPWLTFYGTRVLDWWDAAA